MARFIPGRSNPTMYSLQQTSVSGRGHTAQPAVLQGCRPARAFGARHAGAKCMASTDCQAAQAERRGVLLGLAAATLAALPQLPAWAADEGMLPLSGCPAIACRYLQESWSEPGWRHWKWVTSLICAAEEGVLPYSGYPAPTFFRPCRTQME